MVSVETIETIHKQIHHEPHQPLSGVAISFLASILRNSYFRPVCVDAKSNFNG